MDNIIKGDTLQLVYDFADYSAVTYDIWIALRGASNIDIKSGETGVTITKSGSQFTIDILASTTAGYTSGDYWYYIYMTAGVNRYTAEQGTVKISADIGAITADTYDGRSHVKKVLDAIEAVIEGRASRDQMAYSIQGRSLSLTPLEDLIKMKNIYKTEYSNEQKAEKIARGEGTGQMIKVRF